MGLLWQGKPRYSPVFEAEVEKMVFKMMAELDERFKRPRQHLNGTRKEPTESGGEQGKSESMTSGRTSAE